MSQFAATMEPDASQPPKTSGLAIGSLICSLICCIPVTTILGILLGVLGILSINANPTARKGKGLAVTGLILGVVFTLAQVALFPVAKKGYEFIKSYAEFAQEGPSDALAAGFGGDLAGFRAHFHGPGAAASDAEAEAFLGTLRDRYGDLVSVRFDDQAAVSPKPGQPTAPLPYKVEFSNKTVDVEAELVFADTTTGAFLKKLGYIKVFDPDLGEVIFPPAETAGGP